MYYRSTLPYVCWHRRFVPTFFQHRVIIIQSIVTVGSSIALIAETAKPGAMFGAKLISEFGIAFWSISVSLNVISTLLIAGQLLWHQRALRRLGIQDNGQYTGVVAVLAESAALYSICGLIYIPLFARNMTLQYPFSPLFLSAAVRIESFYHLG